jgi:hypothetical protein
MVSEQHAVIQNGRDYFLAVKPGYHPYTYPHPLITGSAPIPTAYLPLVIK